jgi:hypothetical protein
LFSALEQPDAKIRGGVNHLSVRLHDPVRNRKLELAQDHALQVDYILHGPGRGNDHAGKFHLADAERPAFAGSTEPAQEEARQLPQRIEPQAARHHGVAFEVAGPQPVQHGVAPDLEFGDDLALAVRAACFRDAGDAVEHEHGRQR